MPPVFTKAGAFNLARLRERTSEGQERALALTGASHLRSRTRERLKQRWLECTADEIAHYTKADACSLNLTGCYLRSPLQQCHGFHMRGPQELVERCDAEQFVAAVDQYP